MSHPRVMSHQAAALLAQLGAATRIGQEKEREQAAVQLQLDEAIRFTSS